MATRNTRAEPKIHTAACQVSQTPPRIRSRPGKLVGFPPGLDALWRDAEVDVRLRFPAWVEPGVRGERIGELGDELVVVHGSHRRFDEDDVASSVRRPRVPCRSPADCGSLHSRRASRRRGPCRPRRTTAGPDTEHSRRRRDPAVDVFGEPAARVLDASVERARSRATSGAFRSTKNGTAQYCPAGGRSCASWWSNT